MSETEWLPEKLTNKGLRVAADPPGDAHFGLPGIAPGNGVKPAKASKAEKLAKAKKPEKAKRRAKPAKAEKPARPGKPTAPAKPWKPAALARPAAPARPTATQKPRGGGNGADAPDAAEGLPDPLKELERVVSERIAVIESRIESRMTTAVDSIRQVARRAQAPAPQPAPAAPPPASAAPVPVATAVAPDPAPNPRAIERRLNEAERRVDRAALATERDADEVHRIVGAGNGSGLD